MAISNAPHSPILYFAYGSNMDTERITDRKRCPQARYVCVAKLRGQKLAITRESSDEDRHGVADIVPSKRHVVWGVVWELTREDLERLDIQEGTRTGAYQRTQIRVVERSSGREISCETYVVPDNRRAAVQIPTTKCYLRHLLRGAKQHELPSHYRSKLRRLWDAGKGD